MPFFNLAQVSLNDTLSVGNLITLAVLAAMFFFIWVRTKRDVELSAINGWIEKHERDANSDRDRLRMVENAVIELTALQQTMKDHLTSIDRRHERADEMRGRV